MLMKKNKFYGIENKIDRIIFATENNIEKHYKEAADAIKKEIADLYEQHGELTNATMNKYNRLRTLEDKLIDTTNLVYQANRKEINATLRQAFLRTSKELISVVNDETGRTLQPIVKGKRVTEVINSKVQNLSWRDRMGKHQGDVLYDLKKEIGAGIEKGETYAEVAKRIQKQFDVSESRAKTIARNETARVKSASEQETMDGVSKAGVKMTKTWNNVLDERSREQHVDMNGATIPYDDLFELPSGASAKLPRLSGNSSDDINCRCFASYGFEDWFEWLI